MIKILIVIASLLLLTQSEQSDGDYNTRLRVHTADNEISSFGSRPISLVVHLTIDRKEKLRIWCKDWRGPMSVSLYIRPQDTESEVLSKITGIGCIQKHANIHIVTPGERILAAAATDMLTHYPFNVMRNAALDGADTELVFLLDVDLQLRPKPTNMRTLSESVKEAELHLNNQDTNMNTSTRLYIVPAFETVSEKVVVPNTFDELMSQFNHQQSTLFYGHYCVACHHPTDVLRWTSGVDSAYTVRYVEDFEPYVVAHKSYLPRYDNRFIGRGWDKMSFFYELSEFQFSFHVLPPPVYLIHKGRGDLPKKGQYTPSYMKRQQLNKEHWLAFKEEIQMKKEGKEIVAKSQESDVFHDSNDWSAASLEAIDPEMYSSSSLVKKTVCIVNREDDVSDEKLQNALNWVCSQDDHCKLIRHFPESLQPRADWAFDRWYQKMVETEGENACDFGGVAKLTECDPTPMKCIPVPDASDDDIQEAIDWVCHTGIGSCGWTMEGGPHFIPNTLRHHASVIFTQYYLIHRCYQQSDHVCDFNGNAMLVPIDSWNDSFIETESTDEDHSDEL